MADYSGGPSYHEMMADQNKKKKSTIKVTHREFTDCEPLGKAADMITPDMVNHPPHYQKPWGEVIDITEHMNFNLGNVVKYVLRHEDKGGLEDLKKAQFYLDREITRRQGKKAQLHDEPFG